MRPILPVYVDTPVKDFRSYPEWHGCCVPLAVSMVLRSDFVDVAIAMRGMGMLDNRGAVYAIPDLPIFFHNLVVNIKVTALRLEALLSSSFGDTTIIRAPTLAKFFPRLNGLNRHILTKHDHAIFADKMSEQAYDGKGVFREKRCRITHHFELTIEQCATAKENLTGWLEAYYNRSGIDRVQAIAGMTFAKKRAVRRRTGVTYG